MQIRKSIVAGDGVACALLVLVAGLAGCSSSKEEGNKDDNTTLGDGGASADWTMLGYDLSSTYWNQAETKVTKATAPTLEKAWEFDTLGSVTGTPVIAGGRVYVAGSGLIAIDLASGNEIWRNRGADEALGGPSSLALDGDTLYMHDTPGNVRAFNVSDGTQKWEYKGDDHPNLGGFSSPIVAGDLVIVGGSSLEEVVVPAGTPATFRGFILALKKDGTLAWKKYTVEPPHTGAALWSSVSVDLAAKTVFGATGNNYTGEPTDTSDAFLALPLDTGDQFLWKKQIFEGDVFVSAQMNGNPDGDFGANPILFEVGGRKLAAGGCKMGDIWVVDRADGSIVQQRNFAVASVTSVFKGGVFVSGAWDGSRLLFAVNGATSTGPGSETPGGSVLLALDPLTLDVVWERAVGPVVYSPISVANGVGFYGKDKILQAFDTETGAVLKEFTTEATIATAPAVSNGYVVFGSGMGWLQATGGSKYYALKVQ